MERWEKRYKDIRTGKREMIGRKVVRMGAWDDGRMEKENGKI